MQLTKSNSVRHGELITEQNATRQINNHRSFLPDLPLQTSRSMKVHILSLQNAGTIR